MMFAAGVVVGMLAGMWITLYALLYLPRTLGEIVNKSPER